MLCDDRNRVSLTLRELSRELGVCPKTVMLFLKKLEHSELITYVSKHDSKQESKQKSKQENRPFTICNSISSQSEDMPEVNRKVNKDLSVKVNRNLPVISPENTHQNCIKIFTDWYEREDMVGVKYPFQPRDAKDMQEILKYLKKAVSEKQGSEATIDMITDAWKLILDNFDRWDNFYQSQLRLSQIRTNLPNILANIRGIKKKEYGLIAKLTEQERVFNAYSGGVIGDK